MTTRAIETIAQELNEARTKLSVLQADHEKHGKRAEELRDQGVALIAEGKRSESRRNREARLDAEDEQSACAILAGRVEAEIKALESEHSEAVRVDKQAKLSAADGLVDEISKTLSTALDGLSRAAARHRDARSERDVIARSLGYTTSAWDQTEWHLLGGLLARNVIHSGNLSLDRAALLRFVESVESPDVVAAREAVQAEAKAESDANYRVLILRDEVIRLEGRAIEARKDRTKAGREKVAKIERELGLVRSQLAEREAGESQPAEPEAEAA